MLNPTSWMLTLLVVATLAVAGNAEEKKAPAALAFKMETLDGKQVDLSKYLGKVVLVVNVASECGLTPQYEELQALHEQFGKQGLAVVGFPCNQFGSQEPGNASEIRQFCTDNYGITFDMFAKVDVNGDDACDLYKHLTALETKPKGAGNVSWNFEKFLIDREGNVVARFAPRTKPDAPEVITLIQAKLDEKS